MRRELVEELLDPIFLPHRVNVGNLVIRQGGEVEVNLPDHSMKYIPLPPLSLFIIFILNSG